MTAVPYIFFFLLLLITFIRIRAIAYRTLNKYDMITEVKPFVTFPKNAGHVFKKYTSLGLTVSILYSQLEETIFRPKECYWLSVFLLVVFFTKQTNKPAFCSIFLKIK